MTEKPENPPAFPRTAADPEWGLGTESFEGMSLRDWFAGQALAGFASQHDSTGMWSWTPDDAVREAYRVADAMLTARKAQP